MPRFLEVKWGHCEGSRVYNVADDFDLELWLETLVRPVTAQNVLVHLPTVDDSEVWIAPVQIASWELRGA